MRFIQDNETKQWYFSVIDFVALLTNSKDAKQYVKRMRSRNKEFSNFINSNCIYMKM